ncbi:NAD(P)H-binding protein [Streptomyces sp. BH-SS-21]|uniref:NAD(P)H-binding protein n=1 Tax=Streptomyces liliiviolaceus TaxID=2823109 RepID=A0A940XZ92_9ACTN|nr:NAD(P)H-binding protein [Streptomyces liliiviolaceus]MBQ0850417.1 NAD(P)H-binding protein [Streptomyces liliiviolaceus]
MRVLVAGATGLMGSRTVARLRDHGVEVGQLSRAQGVDLRTGDGVEQALRAVDVVVDVTDAPSHERRVSEQFFTAATGNLLRAAGAAGVAHYVLLSLVGADRVDSGYFPAKAVQERLARRSTVPYSVVRASPFFETVQSVAAAATRPDGVRVAPLLLRPVSVDDVAATVAHVAVGVPLFDVLETAGPEEGRLTDLVSDLLTALGLPGQVVTDPRAPFFGAELSERALLPGPDAHLGHHSFARWLKER